MLATATTPLQCSCQCTLFIDTVPSWLKEEYLVWTGQSPFIVSELLASCKKKGGNFNFLCCSYSSFPFGEMCLET